MARTRRRNDPKLVAGIRRRKEEVGKLHSWSPDQMSRYFRHDDAILRGQDGAIIYDKVQDATIDNEGGYKLNGHDWTYYKSKHTAPARKQRQAGKNLIRSQLNG